MQVWRLQACLLFQRSQAAFHPAAGEQRSLNGIRGLAGQKPLPGIVHQRHRIHDVGIRWQVQQRRQRLVVFPDPPSKVEVADDTVQHQYRGAGSINVFDEKRPRFAAPFPDLFLRGIPMTEGFRLLAAASDCVTGRLRTVEGPSFITRRVSEAVTDTHLLADASGCEWFLADVL